MWSKFIFIATLCSFFSGCLDGSGSKNAYSFAVFLGQQVRPAFSEIEEGDVFGGARALIVSNKSSVGQIFAIFDGDEKSVYTGISPIMLFKNEGSLRIGGIPSSDTYIFALMYLSGEKWELIYKEKLSASEKFELDFSFESGGVEIEEKD